MFFRGIPLDPPRAGINPNTFCMSGGVQRLIGDLFLHLVRAARENVSDAFSRAAITIDWFGLIWTVLHLMRYGLDNFISVVINIDHILSSLSGILSRTYVHRRRSDERSFANRATRVSNQANGPTHERNVHL